MSKNNTSAEGTQKKKSKKKWIIIAVIAFLLIGAAVAGDGNDDSNTGGTPDSSTDSTASSEITTEPVVDTTETATDADPVTEAEAVPESEEESTEPSYSLEFGELVSVITNEIDDKSVIVVKAKIEPSYSNEATVNQNYFNVENLIQEQGCDAFDELQYWAVADMTDGSEQKVVSFTVSSSLIQMIAEGSVPANQLGDYVDDLYILPSLQS